MCLIAFAFDAHPHYSLILSANRDEYRNRPTLPAGYWADAPQVLAGRDCQAGGTWLGITTGGKLAAITNYRDVRQQVNDPPSRGSLVAEFLQNEGMSADDLLGHLQKNAQQYEGFNLLFGTCNELYYFTNRGGSSGFVKPGIHALSNHLLDTPWPKVVVARSRLASSLRNPVQDAGTLLDLLSDPAPFADDQLPDTGIGPDRERFLSPLFIMGEEYATRSTTAILVGRDGAVNFAERGYDNPGLPVNNFSFTVTGSRGL